MIAARIFMTYAMLMIAVAVTGLATVGMHPLNEILKGIFIGGVYLGVIFGIVVAWKIKCD